MPRAYTEDEVKEIGREAYRRGGADSFDEREDLRDQVAALKKAGDALVDLVIHLRDGGCHAAHPGEQTYECRPEQICPACELRHLRATAPPR